MKNWYRIASRASAGIDTTDIYIYDEIGFYGVEVREFINELNDIKTKNIDLRLNTPGGSVFDGNAIFNALKRHSATINAHIDGLAASMGSVIAMAGSKIYMADNAMLMIHNPWVREVGDARALRKSAGLLDQLKESMINTYASKTTLKPDDLTAMMDEETWFDAESAKKYGFIDTITETLDAVACFGYEKLKMYKNVPSSVINREHQSSELINKQANMITALLTLQIRERQNTHQHE